MFRLTARGSRAEPKETAGESKDIAAGRVETMLQSRDSQRAFDKLRTAMESSNPAMRRRIAVESLDAQSTLQHDRSKLSQFFAADDMENSPPVVPRSVQSKTAKQPTPPAVSAVTVDQALEPLNLVGASAALSSSSFLSASSSVEDRAAPILQPLPAAGDSLSTCSVASSSTESIPDDSEEAPAQQTQPQAPLRERFPSISSPYEAVMSPDVPAAEPVPDQPREFVSSSRSAQLVKRKSRQVLQTLRHIGGAKRKSSNASQSAFINQPRAPPTAEETQLELKGAIAAVEHECDELEHLLLASLANEEDRLRLRLKLVTADLENRQQLHMVSRQSAKHRRAAVASSVVMVQRGVRVGSKPCVHRARQLEESLMREWVAADGKAQSYTGSSVRIVVGSNRAYGSRLALLGALQYCSSDDVKALKLTCTEWYNVCSMYHRAKPVSDIAVELLNSEAIYSRNLDTFLSDYRDVLLAQDLLSGADAAAIFRPVEVIAKRAQHMLYLLKEALGNDRPSKSEVAATFISTITEMERDYSMYCASYPGAKAVCEKLLANRSVLDTLGRDTTALTIDSFLIMPVQRVPRYLLMLQSMLRKTPSPKHPNHLDLVLATEVLQLCVASINRGMQEAEERRTLASALAAIADSPILASSDTARLISDKPITINSTMTGSILLLSDRILLAVNTKTSFKGASLRFRSQHALDDVHARAVEHANSRSIRLHTAELETLLVDFASADEMQMWLQQFHDAQSERSKNAVRGPAVAASSKGVSATPGVQLICFAELDGAVLVRPIRARISALNQRHCYVLETFRQLFLWRGSMCSAREVLMAERYLSCMTQHESRLTVMQSPFAEGSPFFELLGGTASMVAREPGLPTAVVAAPQMTVFAGGDGPGVSTSFSYMQLPSEKQGCAVIDTHTCGPLFVWATLQSAPVVRERAIRFAQEAVAAQPERTVEFVLAGHEPPLLQMLFLDWPGMQPPLPEPVEHKGRATSKLTLRKSRAGAGKRSSQQLQQQKAKSVFSVSLASSNASIVSGDDN